jgi:hypothetical protein
LLSLRGDFVLDGELVVFDSQGRPLSASAEQPVERPSGLFPFVASLFAGHRHRLLAGNLDQ